MGVCLIHNPALIVLLVLVDVKTFTKRTDPEARVVVAAMAVF